MLDRLPIGRFAKPVHIESGRTVAEAASVLRSLTRPAFSRKNRKALFVGHVDNAEGRLWFFRKSSFTYPARSLRFQLTPNGEACELVGELSIVGPMRVFVLFYLVLCLIASPLMAIGSLRHGGSVWLAARYLGQGIAAGFLFLYGYSAFALWVGRRAEALGLKVLRHVLSDDASASVALDLLSSSR